MLYRVIKLTFFLSVFCSTTILAQEIKEDAVVVKFSIKHSEKYSRVSIVIHNTNTTILITTSAKRFNEKYVEEDWTMDKEDYVKFIKELDPKAYAGLDVTLPPSADTLKTKTHKKIMFKYRRGINEKYVYRFYNPTTKKGYKLELYLPENMKTSPKTQQKNMEYKLIPITNFYE